MAHRLVEFFLTEASPGGSPQDLVDRFGLTEEQANTKLGSLPWEDGDVERYGRNDIGDGRRTIVKTLPVGRSHIVATITLFPNFRGSVGRGPATWAVDTEIGYQDMLDGAVDDFIYHNERPARSQQEAETYLERMKRFIDSKSLAELYAIERSGNLSMSKFRADS